MKRAYALIVLLPLASACASLHSSENSAPTGAGSNMQQMEGRMQHMQGIMDRIQRTEDAEERQLLMREQMHSMRQSMTMMHRMMHEQRSEQAMGQMTHSDADEVVPGETKSHDEHP